MRVLSSKQTNKKEQKINYQFAFLGVYMNDIEQEPLIQDNISETHSQFSEQSQSIESMNTSKEILVENPDGTYCHGNPMNLRKR